MATPQSAGRPPGGGNILTQRVGPLATWVWLLIGTLLIVVIAVIMKKKQGSKTQQQCPPGYQMDASGTCQPTSGTLQTPDIILQNYAAPVTQTQTQTQIAPPEAEPPPEPTPGGPGPQIMCKVGEQRVLEGGKYVCKPIPKGKPGPKPKGKPTYQWVTVGKWTPTPGKNNLAPWNSTLWGIATHFNVKGGYQELAKLNGIKNPNLIHPGQKIKVPVS